MACIGMLWSVYTHDLHLTELVEAVESTHILTIRACLATEALSVSAVLDRQLCLFDDDITVAYLNHSNLFNFRDVFLFFFAIWCVGFY